MDEKIAWLAEAQRFSRLLEHVYNRFAGEIWLVNNDLYIFGHQHLFEELYIRRLSRLPYRNTVKKVWLILDEERYATFETAIGNPSTQIARNLSALAVEFRRKIHVSKVSEAGFGNRLGNAPWTFYTVGGALNTVDAGNGIVIIRPPSYPFARTQPDDPIQSEQHVAVAWPLGVRADETILLRERIQSLFEGTLRSIDSSTLEENGAGSFKLTSEEMKTNTNSEVPSGDAKEEKGDTWADFPAGADIGVVCALEEEAGAVRKWLKGQSSRHIYNRTYTTGYYQAPSTNRTYTIVLRTCQGMGSVHSAIASLQLIQDWSANWLFLVGMCAGDPKVKEGNRSLRLGDVIVARKIIGYEYQKLQKKRMNPYDLHILPCSGFLQSVAARLRDTNWAQKGITDARSAPEKDGPFLWVSDVDVLCGGKVMDDKTLFDKLKAIVATTHRKIVAVEMEGEGAAAAARDSERVVEFLFIKGVSDYAYQKNGVSDREAARENAARFLFALLDEFARGEQNPHHGRGVKE